LGQRIRLLANPVSLYRPLWYRVVWSNAVDDPGHDSRFAPKAAAHPSSQWVPGVPKQRHVCLSTVCVMPHNGPKCMKCQTEVQGSYELSDNATQPAIILQSSEISRVLLFPQW